MIRFRFLNSKRQCHQPTRGDNLRRRSLGFLPRHHFKLQQPHRHNTQQADDGGQAVSGMILPRFNAAASLQAFMIFLD